MTTTANVDLSALPAEVIAAGRLAGLFTGTGKDDVAVDRRWFAHPGAGLEQIPHRLGQLTTLLAAVLGPGEAGPQVFPGAAWYPLPGMIPGPGTAAHLVATGSTNEDPAPAAGQFGLGLLSTKAYGTGAVQAAAYLPLVAYDADGPHVVALTDPIRLALELRGTAPFTAPAGETFTGVTVDLAVHLDAPPVCTLTFDGLSGATDSAYTSLQKLLASPEALDRIGTAIVVGAQPWLCTYPGNAPGQSSNDEWPWTIGDILSRAGLLTAADAGQPPYPDAPPPDPAPVPPPPLYTSNLGSLAGQTPEQIALNLLFHGLDAFAGLDVPLIELPGGGVYVAAAGGAYGVRAAAQIALGGNGGPEVDLSLGSWMTGESSGTDWMTAAGVPGEEPGLSILILAPDGKGGVKLAPGFELNSVGLNVGGGGGTPLVDVGGWSIGGFELRGSIRSEDWRWGAAARIDDVGVPLGGDFDDAQKPATGNGVVRTLLASGDDGAPAGAPASPVNPAFSVAAGYVQGHDFVFELLDASGQRTDMVWIPVQRRFGPVTCAKVGVEVEVSGAHLHDPVVGVGLDGGVTLGPLDIELDQLTIGVHLKSLGKLSAYDLDLQGLAVSYVSGPIALSGGLVKVTRPDKTISYDGEALIKAEDFALSALGSFGSLPDGSTSLFVFAWIDAPIGGPPFFYVTGLAAGFGYNRALRIPTQDQVQGFPLVAGVSNPKLLGATPPADPKAPVPKPPPATVLGALEDWVPPKRGQYWLAAGVQFTTFEIVNTNALLVVEFGDELVVAVLGVATLKQPLEGTPWVYAELDVEVVFRPREGELMAAAVLAPGSYVLTGDAHLTGGFAFASWFGAEHNGEFVLTLGGYHPAFEVPSYYPQEPRVGIDWKVSSEIVLIGDVYFAMTPAAMMAGGELQVTFEAGPLKAWLKADVDVILFWHPFFLDAHASISVGVSFHIHVLYVDVTLSVEISVDFELWGPPIGFSAHVDWYVVSFTIGEGDRQPPASLGWDDFKKLLPVKTRAAPVQAPRAAALVAAPATGDAPATTTTPAYVTIAPAGGLLRSTVVKGVSHWLVRARNFAFAADCTFPPTSIDVPAKGHPDQTVKQTADVAIRPVGMATGDYAAPQTIEVVELSGSDPDPASDGTLAAVDWAVTPDVSGVPQALWGAPVAGTTPPTNADAPTVPAIVGATVTPKQDLPAACTPEMQIDVVFADRVVNADTGALSIAPGDQPVGTPPVPADSFADIAQVASDTVAPKRAHLFAALGGLGIDAGYDEPLTAMAASPGDSFADEPLEGVAA